MTASLTNREFKALARKANRLHHAAVLQYMSSPEPGLWQPLEELRAKIYRFEYQSITLRRLFRAFEEGRWFFEMHGRRGKSWGVRGTGGAARKLKISRQTIYVWLRELGLKVGDFLNPKATVGSLAMKSPSLRSLLIWLRRLGLRIHPLR